MSNYKNLASTVLENSGQTTDTSITMPSTTAALFPTPPFYATIMPTNSGLANGSNSEIVEVTAATTSGANTIFSISRAQRGTSAISWDANEAILSHAIYTQDMPFIDDVLSTPSSVAYVATDNIQTSAVTTPKIADGAVTSDKIDWATSSIPISIGPKSTTAQVIYLGDNLTLVCGHYTLTSYTTSDSATNVKITGFPEMSSIFSCAVQAMQIGQSASYTSYPHLYSTGNGFDFYIRNTAANAAAAIEVSFHVLGIVAS